MMGKISSYKIQGCNMPYDFRHATPHYGTILFITRTFGKCVFNPTDLFAIPLNVQSPTANNRPANSNKAVGVERIIIANYTPDDVITKPVVQIKEKVIVERNIFNFNLNQLKSTTPLSRNIYSVQDFAAETKSLIVKLDGVFSLTVVNLKQVKMTSSGEDPPPYELNNLNNSNGRAVNGNAPPLPPEPQLRYPKSVFFIISNEFCERFSYYGMRTILALYLATLGFSENNATLIYHFFVMLCYFTPLLGGIIADSYLGKYRTILYVSLLYAVGNVVLSFGSVSALPINHIAASVIGLFLIGAGTGGIKPCVSSFGGDQFVLPQQEKQLQRFFSVFYFSINAGSVISCFITPILRENVQCFGEDTCYPLAFGIPAVLMVLSIIIFVAGKPLYKMQEPQKGNIAIELTSCCAHAIVRKVKTKKTDKKAHWLDYADDTYNKQLIEDTKIVMKLIYLFAPTIVFWALYEQQGSRWTFQANHMDGDLGWYIVQPDQMQTVNAVLCLLFIPLFESVVYPLLAAVRLVRTPLQKLSYGGLLAALAFLVSGFLQMQIEATDPVLPTNGISHLRLYNSYNQSFTIQSTEFGPSVLPALGSVSFDNVSVKKSQNFQLNATADNSSFSNFEVELQNQMISSYILTPNGQTFDLRKIGIAAGDEIQKSTDANAKVKIVSTFGTMNFSMKSPLETIQFNFTGLQSNMKDVKGYQPYKLVVDGVATNTSYYLRPGGVYTVIINSITPSVESTIVTITQPNSINILWQLPQYIIITSAEIMFSITGLEFSFTQSPLSMKSVISSLWLLTDALGNVIIVVIAGMKIFESQAYEMFLFAALMTLVMGIFIIIAMNYRYVEVPSEPKQKTENREETKI